MFGTNNQELINRTLEELEDDATSTTYDEVMLDFINYITHVFMASQDASIYDAIDYMHSDEFHDDFVMHIENYSARFIKPKYSLDDLVIIPREQLDKLIKASTQEM